jgi:hypothetical protein
MTKDAALKLALEALEFDGFTPEDLTHRSIHTKAITAIKQALAAPVQEPVLQEIEQYRMQMAGISTAAVGYWKEGDSIHPDYDTPALRDVAKLYAKYDTIYATPPAQPVVPLTDEQISKIAEEFWLYPRKFVRAIEAAHGITAAAPEKGQP